MKHRNLGSNGYVIGEVGLGCWQFGGDFGPMPPPTAHAILETAAEQGVTFLDTADVYGAGRSEEAIGRFLKQHRPPDITVGTKVGRNSELYPNGYTRDAVKKSIEGSLKRLGTEAIDLIQLHCIPTEVLKRGEVFDWLREFKRSGLIKHFGASVESVEEGLLCITQDGLLSLQIIFNIFRQNPATELLPRAKDRGVGIIVRLPMASGLLSGKFSRSTTFAKTDHRNYNRDGQCFNVGETFAGLPFEKGVELADALKDLVPAGMTMAQLSMCWILDHEAVSVVIPGASSPEQAKCNAEASGLAPLPRALHEQLASFYQKQVRAHIRGPD